MMRLIVFLIISLSTLFLFQNCGSNGTETGNETGSPNSGTTSSPEDLLVAMCTRIHECNAGANMSTCQTDLLSLTTVAGDIGLASNFGTFQQIIDADTAHTITENPMSASGCTAAILTLSCSSTEVTTAYSAASPTDFSNAANIIPSTNGCPTFY